MASVIDVAVIEDPEAAEVSLDPVRSRMLAELAARIAESQPPGDNYIKCIPDGMPAMMRDMMGDLRKSVPQWRAALEGNGPWEELFEVLTWAQLGRHKKPILIANIGGYWEPLLAMLERIRTEEPDEPLWKGVKDIRTTERNGQVVGVGGAGDGRVGSS